MYRALLAFVLGRQWRILRNERISQETLKESVIPAQERFVVASVLCYEGRHA